ncbi:DUF1499 domain-containing protein [Pseudodesulfovibrio thermohalotolerans]|uniref:DUF1499 domain-containing protein n=1 Tax=Pseudodesulfovibrio thermohalotolerans TaxID=2880651 RepID=UPI0022B9F3E3|nr:DUF1499 domain-containing protein [Pseudodesulfovibrio thermohalotolerans]WFS61000.1 DUF1499 domain-containing protein [Pseudodesulfovibrio thermohalotolerans]
MKQLLATIILAVSLAALPACSTKAPDLGMANGMFAVCPDDVDCISSQADDAKHKIAPITATGDPNKVMVDLRSAIESIFGAKVVLSEGNYLRAEFRSSVLRTIDDAEFFYDEQAGLIHIHALSRGEALNFPDSRKRIEEVRVNFAKLQ